ncbi:MAG: hypothetical protein HY000_10870 [Planctomycetes bacterium]|nr:hypothetical protein [Planctomycetota bacterium]
MALLRTESELPGAVPLHAFGLIANLQREFHFRPEVCRLGWLHAGMLAEMGLSGSRRNCDFLIEQLKAISGRWRCG